MLDSTTKKRIDDCRDVLVGKVPDPKSQIEQITLALIYKFMDDMDRDAVEKFKGKPKFFTGDYEKYGWRKLFDPSLGGDEMLKLYSEALEKLNINPNIPELFRNIFKNAYLPYRDPSTLKLFLKYINEFEYSHSEKLGDAFEYLLSVMGSQGDAGQFRTPRHIIDFVTACVNPQKNETVLDPACGTAGFLLSAYKHILQHNTFPSLEGSGMGRPGDKLTPDQRTKLGTNFTGYDISPDMVRLSLANMYLHGFATPFILEYDTLSSEDRWNETYDVILANPPFMTPKGGIRPHKKFGVQANKAEVLFTDYIAEHLNSNGRAGIVVPNGIVATSQTAYKQLRKMLVQDSLIAVVSLPAGCFNPYSGVKTSVLILDKKLAKKSKHILFLKIENDGFDLGAQRREHDKNDLPLALQIMEAYKECLKSESGALEDDTMLDVMLDNITEKVKSLNPEIPKILIQTIATLVEKQSVLDNKDVVLSGDRYKEENNNKGVSYQTAKLSEVATLEYGYTETAKDKGDLRFIRITDISESGQLKNEGFKYVNLNEDSKKYLLAKDDILMARTGATYGKTMIFEDDSPSIFASFLIRINVDRNLILPKFYWCFAQTDFYWDQAKNLVSGGGQPQFNGNALKEIEIPLPPLEIQQQIVAEIESYQKIIDGAKQIVNNYKPTININPDWEMVELRTLAKLIGGSTPSKENPEFWENGNIDWITCSDFSDSPMHIENSIRKITEKAVKENSTSILPKDTLVLVTRVSLGKMAFVRKPTALNQDLTGLIFDENKISKRYAFFYLLSIADKIQNDGHGATVKGVTRDYVKDIKVPLPSLEEQTEIVKRIEEEQALVNGNKKLIHLFEQKIKNKINEVWGVKEEVEA